MSELRYELPGKTTLIQQTSRFNYGITLQRSPAHPKREPNQFIRHQQSAFTFDHSGNKSKSRLFQQFQDSAAQTIAKNLIEQNILLKEEVKKKQQIIQQLQTELSSYRNKVEQLSRARIDPRDRVIQELKQEIYVVLSKNQTVEQELACLKLLLISQRQQSRQDSQEYQHNISRCRSNSLDFKRTTKQNGGQTREGETLQAGKNDELVTSIKNMHVKIMGFRAQNLKQLWRWLKGIGSTFSNFKRWQSKAQSVLYGEPSAERMRHLLSELIGLAQC